LQLIWSGRCGWWCDRRLLPLLGHRLPHLYLDLHLGYLVLHLNHVLHQGKTLGLSVS
jgi:hypothetical protein